MVSFDEDKAAQSAAFLLHRAGGSLPLLKVMKLLYLAERLSLQRYGFPLVGDHLVSMDHGPVLSRTLNLMNGSVESDGEWDAWVSDRAEHMIALRDASRVRTPEQDLQALSDSDLEVLSETWVQFGHLDRWALVRYTHTLPEWTDPKGSSQPIDHSALLAALGFEGKTADDFLQSLRDQKKLDKLFA